MHIVLRSFVIQICYLRYCFIPLNAQVNSGQFCVLVCQKTNCIIDLSRMQISCISVAFLETFQNFLSPTFCKKNNIKQGSHLLAS